jgi:hypothetical protein
MVLTTLHAAAWWCAVAPQQAVWPRAVQLITVTDAALALLLIKLPTGTILDIYRDARRKLSKRPWRVDDFDAFCARVYGAGHTAPQTQQEEGEVLAGSTTPAAATGITGGPGPKVAAGVSSQGLSQQQTPVGQQPAGASAGAAGGAGSKPPFQRVMVFVDNAGADVVLGMLPFVREMLRLGSEVSWWHRGCFGLHRNRTTCLPSCTVQCWRVQQLAARCVDLALCKQQAAGPAADWVGAQPAHTGPPPPRPCGLP